MVEKEKDMNAIKQKYEALKKKYSLPSFEEMNNEFGIEELAEHPETELFARRLRACMVDRVMNLLRIIEPILNPSNAPIFIHTVCKNLSADSQNVIEELYKEGCSMEIKSALLSLYHHDEKEEIELIKHVIIKWKEIKPKIIELSERIKKAWEKSEFMGDHSYLG